ncbi:hypothetical protein BGX31_004390, partial [Mortierella sp. GBA43]
GSQSQVQPEGSRSQAQVSKQGEQCVPDIQTNRSVPEPEQELTPEQESLHIDRIVSKLSESLLNNLDTLDQGRLDHVQNMVSHGARSATQVNPLDPKSL